MGQREREKALAKGYTSLGGASEGQPGHTRYTNGLAKETPGYTTMAHALLLLSTLELLLEMIVKKKKGKQAAERVVVLIEGLKFGLRAGMFIKTGRMGLGRGVGEREEVDVIPEDLPVESNDAATPVVESSSSSLPTSDAAAVLPSFDVIAVDDLVQPHFWKGPLTSSVHPTISSLHARASPALSPAAVPFTPSLKPTSTEVIKAFLASKVVRKEDVTGPKDLVRRLVGQGKASEWLWMLRPLLYGS